MGTDASNELQRATPESQGIASSAILRFIEAADSQIHELHSVMLLRHGFVIAEGWWLPYGPEYPHALFSVSKSFTSTAVGLAIAEGRFSIDDPVLSFFPNEIAEGRDFLAVLRVRHLLSMTTGHTDDTLSYMEGRPDGNWLKGFFDVPVVHEPGTHFLYNTGATYVLSAIVQKTTGMKLVDYLESRLFEPLGIKNATWEESPQGINIGGYGLSITTEDLARFGQLYLQKGLWQGRQILPESWIEEAAAYQVSNGEGGESDWTQGYGYQFWRCRHGAYRGDGVFGQYCVVMPEQDAVLVITGGIDVFEMQPPLNLIWDILLPAMHAAPLPSDAASHASLEKKLCSLALPPVQGQATARLASSISGRVYAIDANALTIETMTLDFTDTGCAVKFKTAAGEEVIPCGYGIWQQGQMTLFNAAGSPHAMRVTTSGAWTAEETFTMVIRLYETPFYYTLVYYVMGDEIMIEACVNVSLGSLKPLLLTAHIVRV